eukprot:gene18545-854_t
MQAQFHAIAHHPPYRESTENWLTPSVHFTVPLSMAFREKFKNHFQDGFYRCSNCQNPLFRAEDKFKSTTPWPSYRKEFTPGAVEFRKHPVAKKVEVEERAPTVDALAAPGDAPAEQSNGETDPLSHHTTEDKVHETETVKSPEEE